MIQIQTCPCSTVICWPSGDLDVGNALRLGHVVGHLLRPELDLVIDLGHVAFIDAAGLGMLSRCVGRVRAVGGKVCISHVNPRLQWLFELVGLDRLTGQVTLSQRRRAV
jgi:anti-anti-sigma factor